MILNEVSNKVFRVLTDATNNIWTRLSLWTRLTDVYHNNNSSLYNHVNTITGISSSLTSNSVTDVASASCGLALQQQINAASKRILTKKAVHYTGSPVDFIAPIEGDYLFECYGAQGSDYNTFSGGKGGKTVGQIHLKQGDKLILNVGGQDSYNRAGTGTISNGGGATEISLYDNTVIMCAGGGGGSGYVSDGLAGGTTTRNTNNEFGESATTIYSAGGGGGFRYGGKYGYCTLHHHIGSRNKKGGCYTVLQQGTRPAEIVRTIVGGINGGPVKCFNCNVSSPFGTAYIFEDGKVYWEGTCPNCNAFSTGGDTGKNHQIPYSYWDLGCGMVENQVETSVAAGGGTNYIDSIFTNTFSDSDINSGDGIIYITLL